MSDSIKTRDEILIDLVLHAIKARWQRDLTGYSRSVLARRIDVTCEALGIEDPYALLPRLVDDPAVLDTLLSNLSIPVTEMFRDPEVYRAIRTHVFPFLSTFPEIRIWHAGCATGEEMYSMAILLHEANLLKRCRIFGTDINPEALETAKQGVYPVERLQQYAKQYRAAGGEGSFADYFHVAYGLGKMESFLSQRMEFYQHDLTCDGVFNNCHLILCRNVLIYFLPDLQAKIIDLFNRSLVDLGYLCLGLHEFIPPSKFWQVVDLSTKLYRKGQNG